jgi:hypothetical protein
MGTENSITFLHICYLLIPMAQPHLDQRCHQPFACLPALYDLAVQDRLALLPARHAHQRPVSEEVLLQPEGVDAPGPVRSGVWLTK